MRTTMLLLCLALAGCASSDLTGSTASTGSTAGHDARAAAPNGEWWKQGGVTREKINAMCWMKYEKGRNDMPVEKRADLVDACVTEARKQHNIR